MAHRSAQKNNMDIDSSIVNSVHSEDSSADSQLQRVPEMRAFNGGFYGGLPSSNASSDSDASSDSGLSRSCETVNDSRSNATKPSHGKLKKAGCIVFFLLIGAVIGASITISPRAFGKFSVEKMSNKQKSPPSIGDAGSPVEDAPTGTTVNIAGATDSDIILDVVSSDPAAATSSGPERVLGRATEVAGRATTDSLPISTDIDANDVSSEHEKKESDEHTNYSPREIAGGVATKSINLLTRTCGRILSYCGEKVTKDFAKVGIAGTIVATWFLGLQRDPDNKAPQLLAAFLMLGGLAEDAVKMAWAQWTARCKTVPVEKEQPVAVTKRIQDAFARSFLAFATWGFADGPLRHDLDKENIGSDVATVLQLVPLCGFAYFLSSEAIELALSNVQQRFSSSSVQELRNKVEGATEKVQEWKDTVNAPPSSCPLES